MGCSILVLTDVHQAIFASHKKETTVCLHIGAPHTCQGEPFSLSIWRDPSGTLCINSVRVLSTTSFAHIAYINCILY